MTMYVFRIGRDSGAKSAPYIINVVASGVPSAITAASRYFDSKIYPDFAPDQIVSVERGLEIAAVEGRSV